MNYTQIEESLIKLVDTLDKETFIYELLRCYDLPKASITRLKKGSLNLSKVDGEVCWKKKMFFKEVYEGDLHITVTDLQSSATHDERFVIVTDYEVFLAIDTKTLETLDIAIIELPKHYDFFLPWSGVEKAHHQNENPADVKAAERMAKLFDEIKKDNPDNSPEFIHNLNVFLSRLLFCFFAEDTGIFEDSQFTNALDSHTNKDGSDLHTWLDRLFRVLNTPEGKRGDIPVYLDKFPYVNGGLFGKDIEPPVFTSSSRKEIIRSGDLNWQDINPDIFGSMFQAVIRGLAGDDNTKHYTSVPNIMKVIAPLFLNDLYEEFEKSKNNNGKLEELRIRLSKIKIFDPACGSGNFLIIAYKELRKLEIKIIDELLTLNGNKGQKILEFGSKYYSHIELTQFYGIELDDFACEVAQLSLWLAEHQMNVEFKKKLGDSKATLPLRETGKIICGNACRINWENVCPKNNNDDIYILGNPPYQGARVQSKSQKKDIKLVFGNIKGHNGLDYIACWFYLAAKFGLSKTIQVAFVSTNSICQGSHVSLLWPSLFKYSVDISFAYKEFKWSNNAKNKAGVTVVIVGIKSVYLSKRKVIYYSDFSKECVNISPYLLDGSNLIIKKEQKPICNYPEVVYGNQAIDGGFLTLSNSEKNRIINDYPQSERFIKRLYGGSSLIKNELLWCIWVSKENVSEAEKIPELKSRFKKLQEFRSNGGEVARSLVNIPYRFRYIHEAKTGLIMIPQTSSSDREYIPIGIKFGDIQTLHSLFVIYDPEPWLFSVLTSKMHMVWVRTVAGRLKTDFRYSNTLCYNTFPFPDIPDKKKDEITQIAFRILAEREKHPEKTLAELYSPDKMPEGLREAHRDNDIAIEKCYRPTPFKSDEDRLEYLFKLYERMVAEEQEKDSLFKTINTTKKKRKRK